MVRGRSTRKLYKKNDIKTIPQKQSNSGKGVTPIINEKTEKDRLNDVNKNERENQDTQLHVNNNNLNDKQ